MSPIWCDPDVPWVSTVRSGCIWTVKEISIPPICAHSAHHIWQLFRYIEQYTCAVNKILKNKISYSWTAAAFVEQCLYKCIGFAASYPHKSIRIFICYALKALWYRVWHGRNMSANTMYFVFSHLVGTQRNKYMALRWKYVSFNKTGKTRADARKQLTLKQTAGARKTSACTRFHSAMIQKHFQWHK